MPTRVGLAGAFLVLLWQALTVHYNYGGNWTGLFCTGSAQRVPALFDSGTVRSTHPSGYDGQFYRYIAHDPLLQRGTTPYVDDPRLRWRRILLPASAYVLGAGQDKWIDGTYIALVLASIFAGCYWLAHFGGWWGLSFLLVPAVLASFDRMLLDGTLVAFFIGFVWYARQGRYWPAWIVATLAIFTRETGLFLVLALFLLDRRRWKYSLVPLIAYGIWIGFVSQHSPPSTALEQIASWPLIGHVQRLFRFREDPILKVTDTAALLGMLASFGIALNFLRSEPNWAVRAAVVMFIGLGLLLCSPVHLEDPFGYARPISPVLAYILVRVLEGAKPAWLVAPAAMSIAVGVNFAWQILGILKAITAH